MVVAAGKTIGTHLHACCECLQVRIGAERRLQLADALPQRALVADGRLAQPSRRL